MYKSAIIGLGQIAYKMDKDAFRKQIWTHAKAYKYHNNTKLIAVCDVLESNYQNFKGIYPNIKFYTHLEEMIETKNIEILSICTPIQTHLSIVEKVISINPPKAIFIEKPMGKNLKEAFKIQEICKDSNIILAVNYMRRWENKYRVIKKIILNKELGYLQNINAFGCTALLTSTSHLIDLLLFFGGDIKWLVGDLQTDYVRIVDNNEDFGGNAFIKFKNGAVGLLKGTSKDPFHYMFEIDLLFTEGRITISNDGDELKIRTFSTINKSLDKTYKNLSVIDNSNFNFENNERMLDAVSNIISCINSKGHPRSNGDNAIKVHKVINDIKLSYNNEKIIYYE